MFDWLEDMGEAIVTVGSEVVRDKHTNKSPAKTEPAPSNGYYNNRVATPSAYQYQQQPVAVNSNGAPVQTNARKPVDTTLLIGGGILVALVVVLLAVKR